MSGPLGSMAGLLETAFDVAQEGPRRSCSEIHRSDRHHPRCKEGRCADVRTELNVFPPPINHARDNFFAEEADPDDEKTPDRVHISLLGPPAKARSMQDLPIASLLQSAHDLQHQYGPEGIDPYWTLICYYNSLRELGGAQSAIANRVQTEWMPEYADERERTRQLGESKELNSRVEQNELVLTKKQLEFPIGDEGVLDVVQTTNMFQVGIDVDRLGVMVINGQPKSNSEYIQSSGRVGRKHPGLVVSLCRSTYPRDQSHYEHHRAFHQEFYRHVDMTSTTPFSLRSLDRALNTVLMVLIRMGVQTLSGRESVARLVDGGIRHQGPLDRLLSEFVGTVTQRGKKTKQNKRFIHDVERAAWDTINRMKNWARQGVRDQANLVWSKEKTGEVGWAPKPDESSDRIIITSLRDVGEEAPASLNPFYSGKGDGDRTIPQNHLFSHASPGSLWESKGKSFITLGINHWTEVQGSLTHSNSPLAVRERVLELNPGVFHSDRTRLLVDRLVRVPTDHRSHGHVKYRLFPNTFRCDQGHITSGYVPGDWLSKNPTCKIEGCSAGIQQLRFVSMCRDGHLHAFSYADWVRHKDGCSSQDVVLNFRPGHAYSLKSWEVECRQCGEKRDMHQAPLMKEDDEYGMTCGKFGEPWLKNDETMNSCSNKLLHRQVGNSSVSMAERHSMLLIPLDVAFDLANEECVSTILDLESREAMTKYYNFVAGLAAR